MSPSKTADGPTRVVIAGGGIAGLEALLALRDLAGDRVDITVVAPEHDFTMKPQSVEEPFTGRPADRHELGPAAAELGAEFIPRGLAAVDPDARLVTLDNRSELYYDRLLVCVGAKSVPPFTGVTTFQASAESLVIEMFLAKEGGMLTFAVPAGDNWPLPLYELALMTERHLRKSGRANLTLEIVTPESAPLYLFGETASDALTKLLRGRGIGLKTETRIWQSADDRLVLDPGGVELPAANVVTIPELRGRFVPGLPSDAKGFIPVDRHCRVKNLEGVYAAGDCIDFPVKQGGIGTQQADAAAEHLARSIGVDIEPQPFTPVLRGMLYTGADSITMRHGLGKGADDPGEVSDDSLWWPPSKVSGRYLSTWLEGSGTPVEPPAPEGGIVVDVALPPGMHGQPMMGPADRSD